MIKNAMMNANMITNTNAMSNTNRLTNTDTNTNVMTQFTKDESSSLCGIGQCAADCFDGGDNSRFSHLLGMDDVKCDKNPIDEQQRAKSSNTMTTVNAMTAMITVKAMRIMTAGETKGDVNNAEAAGPTTREQ